MIYYSLVLTSETVLGEHVFAQTSMVNEDFRLAVVRGDEDRVSQLLVSGKQHCHENDLFKDYQQ